MKKILAISFALMAASSTYAQAQPQLLFNNPITDITYPDVAGDYLVYSQRVHKSHQIMRLNRHQLNGAAKHVSASFTNEVVRYGAAIANGDMAFVSNRLGMPTPWLATEHTQAAMQPGTFQSQLMPNHLDVSTDGNTWVFDSSLETSRTPRMNKQFGDKKLNHELLGQAWRIYHERLWLKKSGYPKTEEGMANAFAQPQLFVMHPDSQKLTMLSDGFDASLSTDGSWMVFVRESNGNFDLWRQNIDGTALKRLTTNTYADVEPSLSPDGKRVAFVSNRDSRGDVLQTFIHVLNLQTGKITSVTSGMGVVDGGPAWLDNHTIIFHSNRDPKAPNTDTVDNWRLWTVALPK
jgi:dipeptidyl aminopeptidase/acylaminoacyl peptidase